MAGLRRTLGVASGRFDGAERSHLIGLRRVLARLAPVSIARTRWGRAEEPVEPLVRHVVAERLGVDLEELGPGVSLTDDLAADSLDLVELIIAVEERLGISLPESVFDEIRTYEQLVDVVQMRLRARRTEEARAESARTPPVIWARILPSSVGSSTALERAGWLTPYTAQTIVESALRAGPGSRLEMGVPPNLAEPALAQLEQQFAWLGRRDIEVHIRRDPHLPPLGAAA